MFQENKAMDEMDGESPQEYNGWVVAAMMILSAVLSVILWE